MMKIILVSIIAGLLVLLAFSLSSVKRLGDEASVLRAENTALKSENEQLQSAVARVDALDVEMQRIQSQLNALSSLIQSDTERADEVIEKARETFGIQK